MNKGYKKAEFNTWAEKEKFFPGVDLSDVEYWTNSMSYPVFLISFILYLTNLTWKLHLVLKYARLQEETDTNALSKVLKEY